MTNLSSTEKKPARALGRAAKPSRRKRNKAGRPTADELDRRKLTVLNVATDMFVARGYAATTLLDIAKVAGVATRTLYQHFGDKEDIFREVIFARDTAVAEPPVLESGEDLLKALRKAAQYSYDVALRPRSIDLMRLMIAESARFPELMSKVATTIFTRFTHNLAILFKQLADARLIPDGNHDQSAELFADLFLGNRTVMIYFGWVNELQMKKDIELKIDLFTAGRFGASALGGGKAVRSRAMPSVPAKPLLENAEKSAVKSSVKPAVKPAAKRAAPAARKTA